MSIEKSPFDLLVQDLCELQERREFKQSAQALRQERQLAKAAQARDHAHRIRELDQMAKAHQQSAAAMKKSLVLQKFAALDRAARAGELDSLSAAKLDVLRHRAAEEGLFDHRRTYRGAA